MVLNQQFIQITDRAVYESQENNPDREIHKEIGYISYDQNRQDHVLCEFHIEGYVNQYVLEDRTSESKKFVFITEITENILAGWPAPLMRFRGKMSSGRHSSYQDPIRSGAAS